MSSVGLTSGVAKPIRSRGLIKSRENFKNSLEVLQICRYGQFILKLCKYSPKISQISKYSQSQTEFSKNYHIARISLSHLSTSRSTSIANSHCNRPNYASNQSTSMSNVANPP